MEKKYYLTKQATDNHWHYIGDPTSPNTTLDTGIVEVKAEEIQVGDFGAFVVKFIE